MAPIDPPAVVSWGVLIAEWLAGLGVLAGGVGYLWGRINGVKNKAEENEELRKTRKALEVANENVQAYKEADELKGRKLQEMDAQLHEFANKISELGGKVETYEKLLMGRDPQTNTALSEITNALKLITENSAKQLRIIERIDKHFIAKQ